MEGETISTIALGLVYVLLAGMFKVVLGWQKQNVNQITTLTESVHRLTEGVIEYRKDAERAVDFQGEMRRDLQVLREHVVMNHGRNSG